MLKAKCLAVRTGHSELYPPKYQSESLTCWGCSYLPHGYPGEIRQQRERNLKPEGV